MNANAVTQSTLTETMLRLVALYRRRKLPVTQWERTSVDPADLARIRDDRPERVAECRRLGIGIFHAISLPASIGAAAAHLILDHGSDIASVNRFVVGLCGGSLPYGDPRLSLRRICRGYAAQANPRPDYEMLAYVLRTWNIYVTGKRASAVTWKVDDGMPRIGSVHT
jgi:hypothetical protein